ncbi:hypothetical protein AB0A60_25300 [Streptomyces sp. NPDC046275]|uniref:hypothetical protein n=1 Tax=Streptomyces sp. NPDC046275 TaxID=3157201 RepID=UPI0033CED96B
MTELLFFLPLALFLGRLVRAGQRRRAAALADGGAAAIPVMFRQGARWRWSGVPSAAARRSCCAPARA